MRRILLTLLLFLSALVLADESSAIPSASSSPAYVNLNSGISTLQNLPTGEWTGSFNAGYNFNPYIALEGGYTLLAGSELGVTTTTNIFDIAAKGTLPVSEMFALYGRAGLGIGMNAWNGTLTNSSDCILCNSSLTNNYGLGLVGLGISFSMTKHVDLRLEDTAYIPLVNTATGAINAVTFGTQYNF